MPSSSESAARLPEIFIGDGPLALRDVEALALGRAVPRLGLEARARMQRSHELLTARWGEGDAIYGVTTGVGDSVRTAVPPDAAARLSLHLLRFHGCGTGRRLDPVEAAAVMAVRLRSIAAGKSGIRPLVADRLCTLLERRILPAIPAEGSVGASGDLTPLSYVAALLVGEREVLDAGGGTREALAVLSEHDLPPLELGPKEALALMNGTSVATALGVLALGRARRIAGLSATLTAMASAAIGGNPEHFDPILHEAKGHPGQRQVAAWIAEALAGLRADAAPVRLQDRYSIRCAPQVLGVLVDALAWSETVMHTELNGVSDNPIVDAERGVIVHGGNFYGGHVAFVMDGLKAALANVADLLDRQLVLLCLPSESDGLPANLVGVPAGEACTHHGFKAMSITASALAAEALKLAIPATIFSRSTESHNQDKVPMATIAARDALRIAELTEQVLAIALLAACQALELRHPGRAPTGAHAVVREQVAPLRADRRMDRDIELVLALLRSGRLDPEGAR